VTDFATLEHDFNLTPLDNASDDPNGIGSLAFTENTSMIDAGMDNVILVGAEDVPEPSAVWLWGMGLAGLMIFRKLRPAKVA